MYNANNFLGSEPEDGQLRLKHVVNNNIHSIIPNKTPIVKTDRSVI
jgi:hypothetical protein